MQAYVVSQADLQNMQAITADQIFKAIGEGANFVDEGAKSSSNIYHLFHPQPDKTADQVFKTISESANFVEEGSKTGSNIYNILFPEQKMQLQNLNGEFDKTMQTIAALAPIIGGAAAQGSENYQMWKNKETDMTDAQKIMMMIAKATPLIAQGTQTAGQVHNIWSNPQVAYPGYPGYPYGYPVPPQPQP